MRRSKRDRLRDGELRDSDFFACWHCSLHYRKVDWLLQIGDNPWTGEIRDPDRSPTDETVAG